MGWIFSPGSIVVDAKLYIVNMDDEKRLQLCDIADGLLTDISQANITTKTITNLKIQNLGKIYYLTKLGVVSRFCF